MNRRDFLKLLTLAAGTLPACSNAVQSIRSSDGKLPSQPSSPQEPCFDYWQPGMMRAASIGVVATGSAACSILGATQGQLPLLSRSIAIDTSPFALYRTQADHYIWIGNEAEASTEPNTVRRKTRAAQSEIDEAIQGLDLICLLCSLGGAAGSGIAPIVAERARTQGIPLLAWAITPFSFEGTRRSQIARAGLNALSRRASATIELANQTAAIPTDDIPLELVLTQANRHFEKMYYTIAGIANRPQKSRIKAFLLTTTRHRGKISYGLGTGNGDNALQTAFSRAVEHLYPRTECRYRLDARNILITIQFRSEPPQRHTIDPALPALAASLFRPEAQLIWESTLDPMLDNDVSVTILSSL